MPYNKASLMGPVLACSIAYFIIEMFGAGVQATHFRGGTISWKPSDSFSLSYREVIFTFKLGWRLSRIGCDDDIISSGTFVGEDARWFCMYGCEGVVSSTREKCTEYNLGEDWMFGTHSFKRVFDSEGPFEISYMECCWLTDLVIGAGGEWALTTKLNLGIRSDTGGPNTSPVTAMAPLITLRAGVADVIDLAVRDEDGDKVTCRLGRDVGECGTICKLFPEFTLDEENCLIRYKAVSNTTGKIPVAVIVEDHHRSNVGITMGNKAVHMAEPLSSVPVQFIVILEHPPVDCFDKPIIKFSIPTDVPIKIRSGRDLKFSVTSTPCDVTSTIEEFILIAPFGVRRSPIIELDGTYMTEITWTPTPEQDGSNPVCVTARSSNGVLSEKLCVTVEVPKATASCSVTGGPHFITFDDNRYDFDGICHYELVRTRDSDTFELTPFSIYLKNENTHNGIRIATLTTQILDQQVVINSRGRVKLNGVAVNLPIRLQSGLRIETSGRGISLALSSALRLSIDGESVAIHLPRSYAGQVQGLCGNYNGAAEDDLVAGANQIRVPDATDFGIRSEMNDKCNDELQISRDDEDRLKKCPNLEEVQAKCNILREENGCFSACHEFIEPKNFYENCESALCEAADHFTELDIQVRAYADECQREAIEVCDWRSEVGIAMECAPFEHYERCAKTIAPTCADTDSNTNSNPSDSCIEGCVCDKGYLLSGSICVPESECGCIIKDKYYPKGFTYRTDDCKQQCVCGEDCTDAEPCGRHAKCEKGTDGFHRCVEKPRRRATCKVVTDPHYETFDGTKFDSMGTCAYIMVRSKRNSTLTSFTVVAVNERPNPNKTASHVKEVHVHFGDGHTLTFLRGPRMILNDKEINPGSNVYGVEIRQVGNYVVGDFNFGLVVRWDGIDRLRIVAWSSLRYMVEGLCGDFDDNPDNDFAVRPTAENLPDPGSFAQSWRIEGYGRDGCHDYPGIEIPEPDCKDNATRARYEQECSPLIDLESPFSDCFELVNPDKAYQDCVYDLCVNDGDRDLKERIFESYAEDCLEESGFPKAWRPAENLIEECTNGTFSTCMEQCQPTCTDPDASQCREKTPDQLGDTCVEGCVCAPGLLLSGSSCVRPEDCGCFVNGRYEKKGFRFAIGNCSDTCECMGPDDLMCEPTPFRCLKNRDMCVQREDGYFECVQRLRRRATCSAVTDPHYMTFDRKRFDSMGTCAYIMVRSKDSYPLQPFRVVAVNEQPTPDRTVSHVKEAWVNVGEDLTLSFTDGGIVTINGQIVNPGTNMSGVEIRRVGRFVVAAFDFGLVVRWDGKDRLRISAWGRLRGQMEGLCGDFDDDEANDFMTPDGNIVQNITDFVDSWKIDGYHTPDCRDTRMSDSVPPCLTDEAATEAKEFCQRIMDEEGAFADCHEKIGPLPYFENCRYDYCAYPEDMQLAERVISEYEDDCKGEDVIVPPTWRGDGPDALTFECMENMEVNHCTDQCQPTCTDRDGSQCRSTELLGEECVSGCVCKDGFILSGDKCVLEEDCGCMKSDGKYLTKGFKYRTRNCSLECECVGAGEISCKEANGCPKNYRCRFDTDGFKRCIPHERRRATCKAVTDPHYGTFDGVNYDSMGTCAYTMVRSRVGADVTSFRVVAVNEEPKRNLNVSHVKEVFVYVGDDVTLSFKAGPIVSINDEVVMPGTTLFGIQVRKVGLFTVAEFPFGLVIRWDGIDRLRITAWAELKNKVEGLCGDFNDNPDNDFMMPDGTITTELIDFVNSWAVDGYDTEGCKGPSEQQDNLCEDQAKLDEFLEACRVLIDASGPFSSCGQIRDPQSPFNNCVYDLCAYDGNEEIRQRIIASFAEDCKEDSPESDPIIFVPPENRTVACYPNSHYVNCMSSCQPTCRDMDGTKCKASSRGPVTKCEEGCKCDDGYIESGDLCVLPRECGCAINGRYVEKGATRLNNNCSTECTCHGEGNVTCVETGGCPNGFRCRRNDLGQKECLKYMDVRRRATCSAVTDPHYMTFDRKRYDSMGTCAYMMVRSRQDSGIDPPFRVIAVNERPKPTQIVSHVKEVHVEVGRDLVVSFHAGPVVKVNGEVVLPGSRIHDVEIRQVGRFLVAEFEFGLVIRWDGIDRLRISAWSGLHGKVEGLCGDYNDDPDNDFTTPRGNIEDNLNKFVKSWKVHQYSPKECFEAPTINETTLCNEEDRARYEEEDCFVIIDPLGPFGGCHEVVEPKSFYDACVFDQCGTQGDPDVLFRIIHEYTETCLGAGDPNDVPGGPPENITIPCPENSVQRIPMEQCQPTCDDLDASVCKAKSASSLGLNGIADCKCIDGYVLSGSRCVPIEECGCLIDGRYREKGFQFLNYECNLLCECMGRGTVNCTSTEPCSIMERCGKNDQQLYQCQTFKREKATCKGFTDPHFTTYDGKTYDSKGTCSYIMTRSKPESDLPEFRVIAVHESSDNNRTSSSIREVRIQIGDDFELLMVRDEKVRVNGVSTNHGSTVSGAHIRKVGLFTVIDLPFGLVVRWDGINRLRVTAWEQLRNKVSGLCGNFNEDKDDDMMTSDGDITTDVETFVESWKADKHHTWKCEDTQTVVQNPCSDIDLLESYREECSPLTNPDGPFALCHKVVNPVPHFDACVRDLCQMHGEIQYKQQIFTSFVHDCLELSESPDPWRTNEDMPLECPDNSKPSKCMHQCQPTCGDLDASICKKAVPFLLGSNCVEGCKCNSGFYLSDKKCVPMEKCGCLVRGIYYNKGFSYKTQGCTHECTCLGNNTFECNEFRGCLRTERCAKAFGGYNQCLPGSRKRATCKAITDPHYTTFDNRKFDSQGVCSYTMVRSKSGASVEPFRLIAVNDQPLPETRVSHVKEVHLEFKGNLKLSLYAGPVAKLNGEVVLPGTSQHGLEIRKVGRFLAAILDFGITIRWDGNDRLRIIAWGSLRGQIEGICGDFNDDPADDLVHAGTGEILTDVEEFVNSWRVHGYGDECPEVAADFLTAGPVFTCEDELDRAPYEKACAFIKDPKGVLMNCQDLVDAETVFHDCVLDMCAYGGNENIKERVVADFSEVCREEGGEIDDNWREVANLTSVDCPVNSHFVPCMSQCQPSCDDVDGSECSSKLALGENCVEGCHADDGYVKSGDIFSPMSECGCKKDGRYHLNMEEFYTENCATLCRCEGGVVTCNAAKCGREEECVINAGGKLDCVHIETSTCHAWGSSHFSTFDGLNYDITTECNFVLARREAERGNPRSRTESFFVSVVPTPSTDQPKVTVIKNVRLRIPDLGLSILLKPNAEARISGKNYRNWRNDDDGKLVTIDKRGTFIVVRVFFGLEVAYDGTNIRVTLPNKFAGTTQGLCGNYNGDPTDDIRLTDGTVSDNVDQFARENLASSCRRAKTPPVFTCPQKDRVKWSAPKKCGTILDETSEFAKCSSKLEVDRYFEQCIHDLCIANGSNDMLAQILKTYAHECMGINEPVCEWRKDYLLQVACPVNSHYEGCTNACEETCGVSSVQDCRFQKVEDCVCDDGYIRSDGNCVPIANCGKCIINRQFVSRGFTYRTNDCGRECQCVGNDNVVCNAVDPCMARATCGLDDDGFQQCLLVPRERATCQVFGNTHFMTFDGSRFDSTATCAFIVVRSKAESSLPQFSVKVDMQPAENTNLSHIAKVIVTAPNLDFIMAQGRLVLVNGREVAMGSILDMVSIRKIGDDVVAIFKFGFVLRWNGRDNLRIEAWQELGGKLEGLCGDFDEDEKNDFLTSTGVVESDVSVFVNSWRDTRSDKGCRLRKPTKVPCQDAEEMARYQSYCDDLYDSDIMMIANCKLNEYCLYEMCANGGDRDATDISVHTYAKVCYDEYAGSEAEPPPTRLPDPSCPQNSHFSSCMEPCQPTCSDSDAGKCKGLKYLTDKCVRGCECDDGYVLDREQCVKQSECGCVGGDGEYYPNGFDSHLEDCLSKCQCNNGSLACFDAPCEDGQYCGYREEKYGCHWNDECNYNNGGCSQTCTWENQTITCSCRPGYRLGNDNVTCEAEKPCSANNSILDLPKWKQDTMQMWLSKLDAYLQAAKRGAETGDPAYACKPQWTKWLDRDDPDDTGDDESLSELRKQYPDVICKHPVAIEAQLTDGRNALAVGNIINTMDSTRGFVCLNSEQRDGEKCGDFQVRFLCLEELI